ncbi:hypothetical protein PanWU01x14_365120 [Parasponia andersonii]|uniref:Reverse transcriptase n=1 Tax=Parasponia andersonii TaxID=3476 RepID=A0A2P5A639_PARAD|nr:hypothetical protein PanWU01x14_365120 [Parasponia andersonii]
MDIILDKVQPKVTCDMNGYLIHLYSSKEVYMVVKDMGSDKSPSLDGLSAMFYQNCWHIIGLSVIRVVLDLLYGYANSHSVNSTLVVLIPKV